MIKCSFWVLTGIMVVAVVYWWTVSVNAVRYLAWRLTSPATIEKGQVRRANADIHYVGYGSGPAVLLLHGGLSNRLSWFSQIPYLVTGGRRVIVPDTRGHGDSGLGHAELSYRLLAADAVAILDDLNIKTADVVGWSDGGNTALLLARYWPQRVGRIVVISANFNPEGLTVDERQEGDAPSSGITRWFRRWWTGAGDRLRELERRVQRMWRTRPTLVRADLARIIAPTLVVVGEKDVVATSHARQMAAWLVSGSLAVLPAGIIRR